MSIPEIRDVKNPKLKKPRTDIPKTGIIRKTDIFRQTGFPGKPRFPGTGFAAKPGFPENQIPLLQDPGTGN